MDIEDDPGQALHSRLELMMEDLACPKEVDYLGVEVALAGALYAKKVSSSHRLEGSV